MSIDMNQSATAITATMNGKRKNRSAMTPAATVPIHENPAAFDPGIEIMDRTGLAEFSPPAEFFLNAKDRERRHRHGDGD
jgi:hypothetical protein